MPIGVKVGMMVELCPRTVFSPFGGDIVGDHQMRVKKGARLIFGLSDTDFCHLTANISKTVSRSVRRQLELDISSTGPF